MALVGIATTVHHLSGLTYVADLWLDYLPFFLL